ncbi:MAG: Gfo/Idh/MocA family oxidoreductase [Armatimonadetes bacterium]|nr:Gfo/Idh/MocA family oxidoreductase [Armatimonadota bacterium]
MKRVVIVGGETHIGEVTGAAGLEIVGAAVRADLMDRARERFGGLVTDDYHGLLEAARPDIVAVANENDLKAEAVLAALSGGMDVIVDKPLALRLEDQEAIENALAAHPRRRLLNLLTLRGSPAWRGIRDAASEGVIGAPVFCHVRMAVRLDRENRPPWFLDCRQSGGLFLDLLIHGLDMVEWCMGRKIAAVTARTGNLSCPEDTWLRDHAAVFCEMEGGGTAVVEGQRLLPDTKGSDYRMTLVGTKGYADLVMGGPVTVTSAEAASQAMTALPQARSVVEDWLEGGNLVPQDASLRANRLAILATISAERQERIGTL